MPQLLDFLRKTVQTVHGRFVQTQLPATTVPQVSDLLPGDDIGDLDDQWQEMFGEAFDLSMQQLEEENLTMLEGQFAVPDFFGQPSAFDDGYDVV